jgi:hypothetical protein
MVRCWQFVESTRGLSWFDAGRLGRREFVIWAKFGGVDSRDAARGRSDERETGTGV